MKIQLLRFKGCPSWQTTASDTGRAGRFPDTGTTAQGTRRRWLRKCGLAHRTAPSIGAMLTPQGGAKCVVDQAEFSGGSRRGPIRGRSGK